MKNRIKANIVNKLLFVFSFMLTFSACDEAFLEEVPKDFLSPENAYTDYAGFETAITTLHSNVRDIYIGGDGAHYYILKGLGADFAVFGEDFTSSTFRMNYDAITSTDYFAKQVWDGCFKLIKNANVIITRAESERVNWNSETEKNQIVAEARFFRAWGYRVLGQFFGGVPIIDEEITSAKIDFVRDSQENVYQFAKQDLVFAAANLPDSEKQPGRITKAAANHLLAEVCITLEQWDEAINAASAVINNPSYELMTERFGVRSNEPGDVYWDLFRMGNQNRNTGNKEAIWVLQIEYNTLGGTAGWSNGYTVERAWGARYHSIKDPDGKNGFILDDSMGRPVGWCVPTYYLQQQIWQDDWDDMRNSEYNIKREFYYNNPESNYFGQLATPEVLATQPIRYWHPYFQKATTPNRHPDGIINSGRIFRDIYAMRLAETYLLRAEAYLGKGQTDLAAEDINVVRARANASLITASDVDINFILDERARELTIEELRTLTLMRLGLMYERTKDFSYILQGDGSVVPSNASLTIQPHNNLYPIPQTEIDLNGEAVLEQNPGYE